jgi:hypothetical protein
MVKSDAGARLILTAGPSMVAFKHPAAGAAKFVLHKRGAAMSSICVLRIPNAPNVKSRLQEESHGRSTRRPISLLAFLQAENRRLQDMVAELEKDTMALREALQNN